MNELSKIRKVIEREFPEAYLETLIVLDGTTGQNALVQAKQFKEVSDISGIVLTKLDGTAKGGIAIANSGRAWNSSKIYWNRRENRRFTEV